MTEVTANPSVVLYLQEGDQVKVANSPGAWVGTMAGDPDKMKSYVSITLLYADD